MTVTRRIRSTYQSVLYAKLYFFFRKSIWKYLLGMLLLAYAFPLPSMGLVPSALIYFLVFALVVLVPLYHFSSKAQARKSNFDADITFSEENILIRHRNKDLAETKEWSWIKKIDITQAAIVFVTEQVPRFLISFSKNNLSQDEQLFFSKMKAEKQR